ncbi:MAG TPA: esterase-like activity of phytase family protein [Pirellulales bacterium]|nr:esterase-like activity of phytase family protein [Pirellulales bacterium]
MKRQIIFSAAASLTAIVLSCPGSGLRAEVVLLGAAGFPGDASDLSKSAEPLEDGTPANRFGGISAIEYSGADDRYLVLSDRGPADGAASYRCRFHLVRLTVAPESAKPVAAALVSTTFLRDEQGQNLVGAASAFDAGDPAKGLRFDPESIRRANGRFYISDEYGPFIAEFSPDGVRSRLLGVPTRFQALHPAATPEDESRLNSSGRQTNAGLEGMAATPDGKALVAIMQRPLIQDCAPGAKSRKRQGRNNRVLKLDPADGGTREYVYVLDDPSYGVSEVLAINDHEFLVLERDGKGGGEARCKRIYQIDLRGASDVSDCEALPVDRLPENIRPVGKSPFLDLLEPRFAIKSPECPAKFEGLAFGPDLADGRRLLVVACDSDFDVARATIFYAFAVDRDDLPRFGWLPRADGASPSNRSNP